MENPGAGDGPCNLNRLSPTINQCHKSLKSLRGGVAGRWLLGAARPHFHLDPGRSQSALSVVQSSPVGKAGIASVSKMESIAAQGVTSLLYERLGEGTMNARRPSYAGAILFLLVGAYFTFVAIRHLHSVQAQGWMNVCQPGTVGFLMLVFGFLDLCSASR